MQISTMQNPKFENPFRKPSNRTQVNILKKKFLGYFSKNIWFRVCSVTAKMFELRNSGENRRKRSKIFLKIYQGNIRIWFLSKKNSKLSHACVPLNAAYSISCVVGFYPAFHFDASGSESYLNSWNIIDFIFTSHQCHRCHNFQYFGQHIDAKNKWVYLYIWLKWIQIRQNDTDPVGSGSTTLVLTVKY